MLTLNIETSSNICSCSILENNKIIKELIIEDEKTHSEKLMPLITEIFSSTALSLNNIDLIACDKGPGSFTGIRIGIATVKALAQVKNIPVIGISSLEGLAYNINIDNGIICSLIDARNNQVYCGIFNSKYELLQDYLADDINIILSNLSKYSEDITFIGDGSLLHKELLSTLKNNVIFSNKNKLSSISIGLCAIEKYNKGIVQNADTLLPLYLRKSQAERIKELNEQKCSNK